jgi:GTPase SAR1 family protein
MIEVCVLILLRERENDVSSSAGLPHAGFEHSGYVMNLDPAVMTLPFGANIDIRDTVKYKEVMKQFNLGPNGGILTSLNLFATRFDEV